MKIDHWSVLLFVTIAALAFAAQQVPLTPKERQPALASPPQGSEAERRAERIREYFGKENVLKGGTPRIDGLLAAWAIEIAGASGIPQVVSEDGKFNLKLARVGTTDLYAAVATLADGTVMKTVYQVDGKRLGSTNVEAYAPHP